MADNAFYPGYVPTDQDVSGMFPGYYPGQKLPFNKKFVKPLRPFDFTMDQILEDINNLELELTNRGQYLPGWVKERIVDDFKQQLKATVKGSEGIDVETLDEYDPNALPGAFGLSLNLNPMDWAKDPGLMAKKTLTSWKNTVVNWQDVETRVRENLWTQVVREKPDYTRVVGSEEIIPGPPGTGKAPFAKIAADSITNRMMAKQNKYGPTSGIALVNDDPSYGYIDTWYDYDPATGTSTTYSKHEYNAKASVAAGSKVLRNADEQFERELQDKMRVVANKVIKFERYSEFAPKRDSVFDEFESSVFDAIKYNLGRDDIQTFISKNGLDKTYEVFVAKTQISEQMAAINKAYSGKGGLRDALDQMSLEGDTSRLIGYEKDSSGAYKLDTAGQRIVKFDRFQKYTDEIDKALADLDTKVFSSTATLKGADPKEFANLQKMMTPYKQHLEALKDRAAKAKAALGTLDEKATIGQRGQAITQIRSFEIAVGGGFKGKGLTGGDMVIDSMQRSLLRNMSDEFTKPGLKGGLGQLVSEIEKDKGELRITRLKTYVDRLRYERDSDAIDTMINILERGNLMESLVWNRIKKYVTGVTPGYYTERALKQLSYFGLVIKDDEKFEQHAWIKGAAGIRKAAGGNMDRPGWMFGNNFDLNEKVTINYKDAAGNVTSTQNVTFKGKLWGGKHFEGIEALHDMRMLIDSGTLTPAAFGYLIAHVGTGPNTSLSDEAFKQILARLNGGMPVGLPSNIEDFEKHVIALRNWVTKNSGQIGSSVNTSDPAFWIGFVDALKKKSLHSTIGLTRRYAGLLEKLVDKLNFLQNVVLAKFGKYLAPIAYVKTVVVEAISQALIKLLDAAAGAASGGLLAGVTEVIGNIIKPVIRWVVRRVVDATEVVFKGFVKGDIFLIWNTLEKTVLKFVRVLLIIAGIPFFGLLLVSSLFMGGVLTTFSPIDPTTPSYTYIEEYGGGIDNNAGPGIPPPDVPPIDTGGNVVCGGSSKGKCVISYPSYGTDIGHGTNHYWSGGRPCRYSLPYIAFPDLRWSSNGVCIGSCSPDWDPGNVCSTYPNKTPQWHETNFYGFATDYQTTCGGDYARAVIAPSISGISTWTVSGQGCANGTSDSCTPGYYFVNLSGSGSHVVLLHLMHLQGLPTKSSYNTGEVVQQYETGLNHVHVEVLIDDTPQRPESVFACD